MRLPVPPSVCLSVLFMVGASGALAQVGSGGAPTSLERQTDDAFRQLLARPADQELLSRYADLLIQAGNYEGGIAALERLLVDPAAPPRIRLDLAALYFKLRSYAMAQNLLETALAGNALSPAERAEAQNLLREVKRRDQRSLLTGVAAVGARRQSNPSYLNDASRVFAGGVLVDNPASQRPKSDSDWNVSVRLNHRYDLELGREADLVSTLGLYHADYRATSNSDRVPGNVKPYDLVAVDGSTGIQWRPVANSELELRPFVSFTDVRAQGRAFFDSVGLGVDVRAPLDNLTLVSGTLERHQRNFSGRADVPQAALLDGHQWTARATLARDLGSGQFGSVEVGARRIAAGAAYLASTAYDLRVNYVLSYAAPVGSGNWTTGLSAGVTGRKYRGPDPAVLATQTRKDTEWRVTLSQTVPLGESWSLQLLLEHGRNDSNLPNYEFRNNGVSASVRYSF